MTTFSVEEWSERPWVGVRMTAALPEWGRVNAQVPRVYAALAAAGGVPLGGPIYRYHRIRTPEEPMDLTVSVPVAACIALGDGFESGVLPAGRYAVARPDAGPDAVRSVHDELAAWLREHGLTPDAEEREDGVHWAARTEQYLTDPQVEPDRTKWEVEVAYLLR